MRIGPLLLCILLALFVLLFVPEAQALSALDAWNAEARDNLPTPVKVWLGLMMLTNLASVAFLKNHLASRWVFAGFVLSHALVMYLWAQETTVLAGQVSLFHILFWTPGAIFLLRRRSEIRLPSAYGIWATASLFFYFGSMLFDVRDAILFLQHTIT